MVIRIPDTFTVEQSEKYLASIRLEPGGLSFFCCHAATGEDFFSAKVQFEQPQTYVSALKECFFDNECLSWKYKQLCLLATETPYTLVPETYYEKERRDALFAFNFPEASATRQILENKLADGTVLLYALPEEVYSFCARSFAAPEFLHSAALLLEQWKRLSETSLYKHWPASPRRESFGWPTPSRSGVRAISYTIYYMYGNRRDSTSSTTASSSPALQPVARSFARLCPFISGMSRRCLCPPRRI